MNSELQFMNGLLSPNSGKVRRPTPFYVVRSTPSAESTLERKPDLPHLRGHLPEEHPHEARPHLSPTSG